MKNDCRRIDLMLIHYGLVLVLILAVCPSMAPGAPAPDRSTPKAAAATLYRAIRAANAAVIADSFDARTAEQKKLARAMADLLTAGRHLQVAAREKFGESAEPLVADMTMSDELKRVDEATMKQEGDRAELTLPEAIRPMVFVRQQDQWKLDVMDHVDTDEKQLPKRVKLLEHVAGVLQQATDAVAAGKYDTPATARREVTRRLNRAMEETK